MKIAIVGAGVSGLVCAWQLHADHEIVVYEAADRAGGHAHTVDVRVAGKNHAIDTGFVVFNDRTYPNLTALLRELDITPQKTSMSFSVKCETTGLEYNGTSINTLFAQRRNVFRPSFWRMIRGILRFHREAPDLLDSGDDAETLGQYLDRTVHSREFIEHYILPMGGAIWSASKKRMLDFPVRFFVRFFTNHGMLTVDDRPQWFVIPGGSRTYVDALMKVFGDRVRLSTPVQSIRRDASGVVVFPVHGRDERFDKVILACHSDHALAMLENPSSAEREVLGAIGYQENVEVLHTDANLLPKSRLAHASWNAILPKNDPDRVAVTYLANILQSIDCPEPIAITLNHIKGIDPEKAMKTFTYHHPIYTPRVPPAQARHDELNGKMNTYFAGAYWGYGFHEDGVKSALAVTKHFGKPEIVRRRSS